MPFTHSPRLILRAGPNRDSEDHCWRWGTNQRLRTCPRFLPLPFLKKSMVIIFLSDGRILRTNQYNLQWHNYSVHFFLKSTKPLRYTSLWENIPWQLFKFDRVGDQETVTTAKAVWVWSWERNDMATVVKWNGIAVLLRTFNAEIGRYPIRKPFIWEKWITLLKYLFIC